MSFSGVYAPICDVSAYLSRIGYVGERKPTLTVLHSLMECHLRTVPFENLQVYHEGCEPDLSTDALMEKIVYNRRGGYCFELNGLFLRLLLALGFDAYSVAAYVLHGEDAKKPASHQVILVKFEDETYFCDVGFGGKVPKVPTPLSQTCGRFRFESADKITLICDDAPILRFANIPVDPVDFISLNAFCAYSPLEPFIHKQMVWIDGENGRVSLDGDVLSIGADKIKLKTDCELRAALGKYFGIKYQKPLREWRNHA